ncbi:MAG: RNA 2',3'-cyclic phosphodiesterase [Methanolinea sp.]|nr:RNA 2',3'-cyclic phosphodiesterase [Methanolinea sp.]
MDMDRLFIAIELPGNIRESLGSVQAVLKNSSARLTHVDPSIIHVTLKFIGDTPHEKTRAVAEALGKIRAAPFSVRVSGISGNNPRRPRVIWARVEDGGKCGILHAAIEDLLSPLGIPRDNRPFVPHATVARVREFHPDLPGIIRPLSDRGFGEGFVDRVVLKKSTLTFRGPVYEDIAEVLLEEDSP